jgi:hypothetical protein
VVRPRQPVLRDGWPRAETPVCQVREAPTPCRSDPHGGPDGIVGDLGKGVKRSVEVLANCFRCTFEIQQDGNILIIMIRLNSV